MKKFFKKWGMCIAAVVMGAMFSDQVMGMVAKIPVIGPMLDGMGAPSDTEPEFVDLDGNGVNDADE